MATAVRERKNGSFATYILNRYINYSNLCVLSCQFCAFAEGSATRTLLSDRPRRSLWPCRTRSLLGVTEVHMVGGLHPSLKKDWYLTLLPGYARSIQT